MVAITKSFANLPPGPDPAPPEVSDTAAISSSVLPDQEGVFAVVIERSLPGGLGRVRLVPGWGQRLLEGQIGLNEAGICDRNRGYPPYLTLDSNSKR